MRKLTTSVVLLTMIILTFGAPISASAYIGPGMGTGFILAAFGIVATFFAILFAVIYYPIKRFFRTKKDQKRDAQK